MVPAIQKSADELSLWDFTYRVKTPSGKIKWIHASGTPERNGNEVSWYTLLLDITKEKQFELELVDINKQLTRAQSIGSIGSWSFETDSTKIFWSKQIYNLYDREFNLGPPTFDEFLSYHNESGPAFQTLLNSIEEGVSYDVDVKLITKKGELKYIRSVGIPERNSNGEVICFTGVAQDVTEKKVAELELKENQERLTAVTDNIDALVYRYVQYPDGLNKITYINKHVETIYELEQEQVINDAELVWNQILDDDLEEVIYSVNKSSEELTTWKHEFRIVTPSGEKKWLRGVGIPTKERDYIYWNTVVTDITHAVFKSLVQQRGVLRFVE
jgi:PAS domain-containing protein